jgi:hypothetical protein
MEELDDLKQELKNGGILRGILKNSEKNSLVMRDE